MQLCHFPASNTDRHQFLQTGRAPSVADNDGSLLIMMARSLLHLVAVTLNHKMTPISGRSPGK